ncbi:MAG: phosphatidylserine/phosphatidylglycerophosphate/cardiolipin synthase family protein [Clostridiales bacterium]|nr:phosphatidylserine/phosphatidylglycerophosphate/cardiolipin synthase family protein [Clostridiales bacterium]
MGKRGAGVSEAAFRTFILVLGLAAGLILIINLSRTLGVYAIFTYIILTSSGFVCLRILTPSGKSNASWVIYMLFAPVFWLAPFFIWGRGYAAHKRRDNLERAEKKLSARRLEDEEDLLSETLRLSAAHPQAGLGAKLLYDKGFPVRSYTSYAYYPDAKALYEAVLTDLKNAEKFVFIEESKVETGLLWDRIKIILIEKAANGVEIRILTGAGGEGEIGVDIFRELDVHGMKVLRLQAGASFFKQWLPDSPETRGIVVIDGVIAYSGPSYIPAGGAGASFQGAGIRLTGRAAWSMTSAFIAMWEAKSGEAQDNNTALYEPKKEKSTVGNGFVLPFIDKPADHAKSILQTIRLRIINGASRFIYISLPLLHTDRALEEALITAACSGVDIRIVITGCDRRINITTSRGAYLRLLGAGVRIFEQDLNNAGATTCVVLCDDDQAVISYSADITSACSYGNAVWLCFVDGLEDIKKNFELMLDACVEISPEIWKNSPLLTKISSVVARSYQGLL